MATSTTLVPLEQYLRTTYQPDRDWIDGEVRERNVGEGSHASVQGFLTFFFRLHGPEWGVRCYPELRIQTSDAHYRVADVCVVRRSDPFEEVVRIAPPLCIEILSKDDRMSDMQEKIEDYLGMGVTTVWVIDPVRRKAFNTDYEGLALPVAEFLTVKDTPIRVSLNALFEELNEIGSN
jgi:Uma2 family endonuclease